VLGGGRGPDVLVPGPGNDLVRGKAGHLTGFRTSTGMTWLASSSTLGVSGWMSIPASPCGDKLGGVEAFTGGLSNIGLSKGTAIERSLSCHMPGG
jgi:hypothetical protein